MLFMPVNTTKANLGEAEFREPGELAKEFYADIPEAVRLRGNGSAEDGSHTYALKEAQDQVTIERPQAQFNPYVDSRIAAVRNISGWEIS
jgi:hypothetical protein